MITKQLLISGKVQGVFYRRSAKKMADQLKIKGWIKNDINGKVLLTAQGEEGALQQFINWCNHGPDNAIVETIQIIDINANEIFKDFEIIH